MTKTIRRLTKLLSLFLSLLMIYQISPINALAAYSSNMQGVSENSNIESYDESYNFYYDFHSIDMGRAGAFCLNDYSLEPSIAFSTLGISGNIAPVNISMRYNSPAYRFLRDKMGYTASAYSEGWSTNYSTCICELNFEDKTQIAYLSGTGSVILFEETVLTAEELASMELPEGTTKWVPVSNSFADAFIIRVSDDYAMSEDCNIDGVQMQYALYENNRYASIFDICGRFVEYYDTETECGYAVTYLTDGSTMPEAIDKITDGVGNEYRFTYSNGVLSKIKCYTADGTAIIAGADENAAPLEMNFSYTRGKLTKVIFPDGKAVTYKYNFGGILTTVTNIDGCKIELNYTGDYISRITEYSAEGSTGNVLNISWNGNTRTFEDGDGNKQIKTFDDNGKIISIVDGDGNVLFGTPAEEESSEYEPVTPEETTEPENISLCPCENCPEWDCSCECENEEACTCIQCKRGVSTVEDESGNVLSEESFDGYKTMKTENTYADDGNHIATSKDTSGNVVYYVYDEAGQLTSMTSGDMEVLLNYDAVGNLTKLSQQVSGLSNGSVMANEYTYTDDKVTSITHNGFSYNFTYDEWGNQTEVKIGERTLTSYEYDTEVKDRLSKINYANGQSVAYDYDENGNISGITYNDEEQKAFEFEYDNDGILLKLTDNNAGCYTEYFEGRTEMRRIGDNTLIYSSVQNADGTETETVFGTAITYTYNSEYNQVTGKTTSTKSFTAPIRMEDETATITGISDAEISVTSDWFGRTESKNITLDSVMTNSATEETSEIHLTGEYGYTYDDTENTASTKIISHSSKFITDKFTTERTDNYEYDESGNITGIFRYVDGEKVYYYTYKYDEAGQLVREDILEDNKTITYTYDVGGNITSKKQYAYTLGEIDETNEIVKESSYSYDDENWKDILTSYTFTDFTKPSNSSDNINTTLTYDEIGNVTSFNGNTYTWNAGRQLDTVTEEDGDRVRYSYNENGYLSKIGMYDAESNETDCVMQFTWDGDRLISRSITDSSEHLAIISRVIYDTDGDALGFSVSDNVDGESGIAGIFLYQKNLQGDIEGIVDSTTGELLFTITYDAYGNMEVHTNGLGEAIRAVFVIMFTPHLYRGYIYVPLGDNLCYYLGSRFYNPQLGRFLNADKHTDTGTGVNGTNMFAYCNNNPVMFIDPTGEAMNDALKFLNSIVNVILRLIAAIIPTVKNYGTEKSPYELTAGKPTTVRANTYWFSCTISGATDINVSASDNAVVVVYKKTLLGKEQIYSDRDKKNINITAKYSNSNTYIVYVYVMGNNQTITCKMSQHVDTYSNAKGAMWTADSNSPYTNEYFRCQYKWYINKNDVAKMVAFIEDDEYLGLQTKLMNGLIAIGDIMLPATITKSFAIKIFSFFSAAMSVTGLNGVDFKEMLIKELKEKSGYNRTTRQYKNGLVLTVTIHYSYVNSVLLPSKSYNIDIWNGNYMEGEYGYCGTWSIN